MDCIAQYTVTSLLVGATISLSLRPGRDLGGEAVDNAELGGMTKVPKPGS